MRRVVSSTRPRQRTVQSLTTSLEGESPRLWHNRRIDFETLPEEELRRDEGKTYRMRKHGNKELPLPPMLDPAVHRAHMRYTQLEQKVQADVPLTQFQRDLAKNPHAHFLAGSIRQCRYTKVDLPVHFFQRLSADINEKSSKKVLKFSVRRHNGRPQDHSVNESIWLLNKVEVFEEVIKLSKKSKVGNLISDPNASQAAAVLHIHKDKFQPNKHFFMDESMRAELKSILLGDVHQAMAKSLRNHRKPYTAASKLQRIAAFVRRGEEKNSFETVHGKPCYVLTLASSAADVVAPDTHPQLESTGSQTPEQSMSTTDDSEVEADIANKVKTNPSEANTSTTLIAITKHEKTIPILTALDKLFTFERLYTH